MTLVNSMMAHAAQGRSSPDAPPIPDVLRNLLPALTAASRIACAP